MLKVQRNQLCMLIFIMIFSARGLTILVYGSQPSKVPPFIRAAGSPVVELHSSPSLLTHEESIAPKSPNMHRISPSSIVTPSALLPVNLSVIPSTPYASSVSVQDSVEIQSSFDGLYYGYMSNRYVPSDVQLAVGPNHLIQMVNVMAGIYAKNGSLLQAVNLNSFFRAGNDNMTDPRVFYDSTSSRWFASILDTTTFEVGIAVSDSSDPLGNWHAYTLSPSTPGYLLDEPVLGVTLDKVVVSVNTFNRFGGFVGAEFWVMNKSAMMKGGTSSYVHFGPYVNYLSIYPTTNLVSTQNQYMVSVEPGISGSFVLFSVVGTPPDSVTVVNTTLSIKNSSPPVNGIQPSTRRTIDVSDGRVLSAIWTQSRLWFAFADSAIPAGDNRSRSSFRLVQVNTDTNTVLQDFDVNAAGFSYFYPALAVDGEENLFVLFGYSSPNDYPGLMVTAQARTDSTGTYQKPLAIIQGTGPETSGRYGDYFGATVDPSNPLVMWGSGQYGTENGWATRIVSISIPATPATPPTQAAFSYNYAVIGGLLMAIAVLVVVVIVALRRGRSLGGSKETPPIQLTWLYPFFQRIFNIQLF